VTLRANPRAPDQNCPGFQSLKEHRVRHQPRDAAVAIEKRVNPE
jgi:hypothetical protein